MPSFGRTALTMVVGLGVALPLAGCSIIRSDNSVTYTGNYVPSDSFSRIKQGESTAAFVEATLGEPSSRTTLEDGSEIWRWDYVVRKDGEGSLLFVFDGESSSQKKHASYVQIEDGVVIKKWRS